MDIVVIGVRPCAGRARLAVLVAAMLLGGCAAERAFNEGNDLLASGQRPEGLAKLEEATQLQPGAAQYRMALLRAWEAQVQLLLDQAARAMADRRFDDAEAFLKDAAALPTGRDRARQALAQVSAARRSQERLARARSAIDASDWDAAQRDISTALNDKPYDAASRQLQDDLTRERAARRSREEVTSPLAAAYRQPVNLEFRDAPLRTIFEILSRTSGLNFVFDREVRADQRTSIYLKGSTVEAALQWLLLTNQLESRPLDTTTLLIYPAVPAKQQEYQPMLVKTFYLANADAKRVAETLRTMLKSRSVVVDETLNMVMLRDSPEAVRLAERLVALHDVPAPEVMLEVEVLEVKRGNLLDLGVTWPERLGFAPLTAGTSGAITINDLQNLSRRTIGVTGATTSITATAQDTGTNLLANPRIRVRNREKAKILIGDRVPTVTTNITSNGVSTESINYLDVGLKLDVEPTVYVDNEVALTVGLEVSSITNQQQTKSGALVYQIGARTAQTMLRLKDGENQILAGLINDEDRRTAKKLPGLGELPVLGRLFGDQSTDRTKTEIVLSITPRILRNVRRPAIDELEFDSGTEGRLRPWVVPRQAVAPQSAASAPMPAASTPQPVADAPVVIPPQVLQAPSPAPQWLAWRSPGKVKVGEDFEITLSRSGALETSGSIPVVIEYDPALMQAISVTPAADLRARNNGAALTSRIDGAGQIKLQLDLSQAPSAAPGPFAAIKFKARSATGEGGAKVIVARGEPVDASGKALPSQRPDPLVIEVTR